MSGGMWHLPVFPLASARGPRLSRTVPSRPFRAGNRKVKHFRDISVSRYLMFGESRDERQEGRSVCQTGSIIPRELIWRRGHRERDFNEKLLRSRSRRAEVIARTGAFMRTDFTLAVLTRSRVTRAFYRNLSNIGNVDRPRSPGLGDQRASGHASTANKTTELNVTPRERGGVLGCRNLSGHRNRKISPRSRGRGI